MIYVDENEKVITGDIIEQRKKIDWINSINKSLLSISFEDNRQPFFDLTVPKSVLDVIYTQILNYTKGLDSVTEEIKIYPTDKVHDKDYEIKIKSVLGLTVFIKLGKEIKFELRKP